MLWCCWLGGRKGIGPVKNWVVGCWRAADLHMPMMPLPLTISCSSKSRLFLPSLTFLYISPQPPLRFWTWLYLQKANITTFPTYIVRVEIFSTFHARVEYISGENTLFRLLRYNLASRNSLLLRATKPKHRTNAAYIFVHFSSTPIWILNLTMSTESQESDVSNDILSKRK